MGVLYCLNKNHKLTDSQYSYKVYPNLYDDEKFVRNTIETDKYRSITVNLKKDFLDSCDFSEIFTKDFTARFYEDFLILSRQNSMVRLYIKIRVPDVDEAGLIKKEIIVISTPEILYNWDCEKDVREKLIKFTLEVVRRSSIDSEVLDLWLTSTKYNIPF